jgi:DNA invertase Pin-like site-specific DNA recombinase
MHAGLYARLSEDRDETQLGVGRQLDDCEKLAVTRGWDVADRYVDNDLSAYKGQRRPEYRRMLADIAARRIDAVVVYHQDRLHRQPRELEEFFDVCDTAGLTQLASVSGDVDLATHDGRLKARIMGAVARNQSDAASRRLQRKALEIAQAGGLSGGGTRPFGFESDRVTLRPDEAAVVHELAVRLIAGTPLRSLCADLNARGITTPTGKTWAPFVLRRMLRSGRISGQREHRGELVAKAVWPAIITAEQTTRIRALLDDPSRRASRPPQRYLLKGLLRCSQCETVLVARPREDHSRRYVCARGPGYAGCGRSYALAEPIEEFVTEAVLWRLDSPELANALRGQRANDQADAWQQQVDVATVRLEELADAYGNAAISMREWMAARDPLQRQLDAANRRIARDNGATALEGFVGRSAVLRDRWPRLGIDQKHAIITAMLIHVIVGPGRRGYNRFDPDRFKLAWRH